MLDNLQSTPLLIGLGVVVGTAVLARLYLGRGSSRPPVALQDPAVKVALPLIAREELSHDTRRLSFALPSQDHVLGLPVGQHVYLSARINGQLIVRPYTPVSSDHTRGVVDLVVKVYFKNTHPKFPEGGKMSQHLEAMKLHDCIDFRGPSGLLEYYGCGKFGIKPDKKAQPNAISVQRVNMVAGGTGITPMLQLIREALRDPRDGLEMRLLFANQTPADILCRAEIDGLAGEHPDRLKVWYTVDRPEEDWAFSTGFITEEMLSSHLLPPSPSTLTLLCGPPPMVNFACKPNLDKLGYAQDRVFAY